MLPAATADSNTVAGIAVPDPERERHDDAATDWAFTTTVTQGAANVG